MKPNTAQLTIRVGTDQKDALQKAHCNYMEKNKIEVSFNAYILHLIETSLSN